MGGDGRGGSPAGGMLLGDPPTEPMPVVKGRPDADWWDPAWDADWWGPRWDTVTDGLSALVVRPRTPESGPPPGSPPAAWPAPETAGSCRCARGEDAAVRAILGPGPGHDDQPVDLAALARDRNQAAPRSPAAA